MLNAEFLAAHSLYIENTLRHAFIYELSRHLLLQDPPQRLTILNSEVDDSGVDLVLALGSVTRHIQMKTLNKRHAPNPYNIAEALFDMPGGCVIWMCYDPATMLPTSYHFFGCEGNFPLGNAHDFPRGRRKKQGMWVDRESYRGVKTRQASHQNLTLDQLALRLFSISWQSE